MDSIIDSIIDEKYRVISQLGIGGLGKVYKAEQLDLNRFAAIKVLHLSALQDNEHLLRFEREAKILATLQHPNIVQVYNVGHLEDGGPYMAMEFLEGKSLDRLIASEPDIAWRRVLNIIIQACDAVAFAHSHGVIHRDIKPQNIMIVQSPNPDTVKILDFGLSRVLTNKETVQRLTQTGALIGSVHYMSPELCQGRKSDERSDIYSLGCTLYECLSGRPPLDSDHPVSIINKHLHEMPVPLLPQRLSGNQKRFPAHLELVVFKALQKDPADRFQSMNEFAEALKLVSEERTEDLRLGNVRLRKTSELSSNTIVLIIVGVVILFLTGLVAVPYLQQKQKSAASQIVENPRERSQEKADVFLREAQRYKKSGQTRQSAVMLSRALSSIGRMMPQKHLSGVSSMRDLDLLKAVESTMNGMTEKPTIESRILESIIANNKSFYYSERDLLDFHKAMASIYLFYGDLGGAAREYVPALDLCRQTKLVSVCEELVNLMKNFQPRDNEPEPRAFHNRYVLIGESYLYASKGDLKSAKVYADEVADGLETEDFTQQNLFPILCDLGVLQTQLKMYARAENTLKSALKLAEEMESAYAGQSKVVCMYLGKLYQAEGKSELAVKYLKRAGESMPSLRKSL